MESAGDPTLVVLAAGIGSRCGGLKQLKPIGPHGECIRFTWVVAVTNGRQDGFALLTRTLVTGSGSCVSWMADTGVSTAGGESRCWSRSLGSSRH